MKISSGCFSGVQKAPFVTGLQLCFSSFSSFSTIGCLLPAHPVLAWGPRDSEPAWGLFTTWNPQSGGGTSMHMGIA